MLLSATSVEAQSEALVFDQINNRPIQGAVCAFLRADSSIVGYGHTAENGKCKISDTAKIAFVWTWHKKYISLLSPYRAGDTISMLPQNKVLKTVLIKANKAITISGDTISYVADSFKLRDGANVQDLLKKLPGLQVDKDGTIRAQGTKVSRVLVDGDDFFGEDASIATKNIEAKMVDKVELIDDKTKKEKNTGISEGETTKIINLKLKDEAKKGYFGKLYGEYSNTNRNGAGALLNSYTKTTKYNAYLMTDNQNNDLSWDDRNTYGIGGGNWIYDEDLDQWSQPDNKAASYFYGVIPQKTVGGLNVSQKFLDESGKMTLNYQFGHKNYHGNQYSDYQYLFGNNRQNVQTANTTNGYDTKNGGQATFNKKIDSIQELTLSIGGQSETAQNDIHNLQTTTLNGDQINRSDIHTKDNANNKTVNLEGRYNLKFKKEGRFLGLTANYEGKNSSLIKTVQTNQFVYANGDSTPKESDYKYQTYTRNNDLKLSVAYTEPIIAKKLFLELGFNYLNNNYSSQYSTFAKQGNTGEYTDKVDTLSNDYRYNTQVLNSQFKWIFNLKKWSFNAGLKWNHATMMQQDLDNGSHDITRKFDYLLPFANVTWRYQRNSQATFRFSKSIKPPNLAQIQPLTNNTNPLYINLGNPTLTPSETYRISLGDNFWHATTQSGMWANLNFNYIQNDFAQSTQYLANGTIVSQTVQTNGNYGANASLYYNFVISSIGLHVHPGFSSNLTKRKNFLNGAENTNTNFNFTPALSFDKDFDSLCTLSLTYEPAYSNIQVSNSDNQSYSTFRSSFVFDFTWHFPWRIDVTSGTYWNFLPKNKVYPLANSYTLWNVEISRPLTKGRALVLKLQLYDILNQNQNIQRNFYGNSINNTSSDVLKRMFLVNLTYNFKKKTKNAAASGTEED